MMTSARWIGWTFVTLLLLLIPSCGPSSDPVVEVVVKSGVNMDSTAFKTLNPKQQEEALRLANERHLPVIGNGERYYPEDWRPKPSP